MDCFHVLHITATSTPKHASDGTPLCMCAAFTGCLDDDLYHFAGELSLQVTESSFSLGDAYTLCLLGIPIELTIKVCFLLIDCTLSIYIQYNLIGAV